MVTSKRSVMSAYWPSVPNRQMTGTSRRRRQRADTVRRRLALRRLAEAMGRQETRHHQTVLYSPALTS